jgi:hypothetical protein
MLVFLRIEDGVTMAALAFRTSRNCFAFVAATFLLTAAANSQGMAPAFGKAQGTQTFRVGLKSIAIPSPSSDLSEIGSDYRVLLETLAPTTNRLIAAFNRPEDLHQILTGGDTPLMRYALVEVPRRAEFVDVDGATFKTLADGFAQQFGTTLEGAMKTSQDDINRKLKELNSGAASITIDKPLPLGAFFSKPDAAAFGMVTSVSMAAKGPTTKMVAGIGLVRVQNRILFLYVYSVYKDDTSVQWVRETSEQWADAILKANEQ